MDKTPRTNNTSSVTKLKKGLTFDFENVDLNTSKYKSMKRLDFDMNVVEKWMELKCSNAPKRRSYHTSFIHKETLYILGGLDLKEGRISDISSLHLNFTDEIKWRNTKVTGDQPEPLSDQSGVLVDDNFYLFGGQNSKEEVLNDLYILNLNNLNWEKRTFPKTSVIPLAGHSCNYHKENNYLIIFGGYNKGIYSNYTYFYNILDNSWIKLDDYENNSKFPEGRIKHTGNIVGNYLFIYGGQNIDGLYLHDMWKLDILNHQWQQIHYNNSSPDDIPVGRSGHTSIYNIKENSFYIFGGKISHAQERNELWKYDLNEEKFIIVHDTLLEMEVDSPVKTLDNSKVKQKTSFIRFSNTTENINKLSEITKIQSKTTKAFNNYDKSHDKINYEEMVLGSPNTKKIKLSLIYRMEVPDNLLKQKTIMLDKSSTLVGVKDRFKIGTVPEPRDGHTAELYKENMMVVFGGDRNKFTFNDIYIFNI